MHTANLMGPLLICLALGGCAETSPPAPPGYPLSLEDVIRTRPTHQGWEFVGAYRFGQAEQKYRRTCSTNHGGLRTISPASFPIPSTEADYWVDLYEGDKGGYLLLFHTRDVTRNLPDAPRRFTADEIAQEIRQQMDCIFWEPVEVKSQPEP